MVAACFGRSCAFNSHAYPPTQLVKRRQSALLGILVSYGLYRNQFRAPSQLGELRTMVFVVVSTAAVRAGLQLFLKQGSGRALSASEVPAA